MKPGWVYRTLVALFAVGTVHLLILSGLEVQRGLALRHELTLVANQTEVLAAEVENLREELQHASDPAYLEARARELGYVYPQEALHASPR